MASKQPKPLISPFILFSLALLIFTLSQLHQNFQTAETSNPNYKPSNSINPNWYDVVSRELGGGEPINVAAVNMDDEIEEMAAALGERGRVMNVEMGKLDEGLVNWSELFPEWIKESSAKCPELPMPEFGRYKEVDVVVARAGEGGGWRDVGRLHVNLVVANLLVRSGRGGGGPVLAVFVGCCGPMWEIFRCDDLVGRVGDSWIYKPEMRRIKQKVLLPVGSCQVSPPLPQSDEDDDKIQKPREAYATVLHSSEAYVCGAIALAQSLLQTNTTRDLILLADDHISPPSAAALRAAGWQIKQIRRIRNPHAQKNSYNEWNYSKLRLWQLSAYDKVMFIDADLIATKNLDAFFSHPQISAAANDKHLFNSGLMLLEPSNCTFQTLIERIWAVESYNGGDQGFLNEMFPWWHRLPRNVNKLKYFDGGGGKEGRRVGEGVYALHYLGLKPWNCYRDYDCNWDTAETRRFASDAMHRRWWRVYDKMPEGLRRFCALTPAAEGRIRKYRGLAKRGRFGDGHWKIKIKDPRQILL